MATIVVFQVLVHVEVDDREGRVLSVKVDDEAVIGPLGVLTVDEEVDATGGNGRPPSRTVPTGPPGRLGAT